MKICKKCGCADRYSDGGCRVCAKAYSVVYRAANREKRLAAASAWRKANQDKVKSVRATYCAANLDRASDRNAKFYLKNIERRKQYNAEWSAKNPELRRRNEQNRRARKTQSGGTLSKGLSEKLFKLQKGKCPCCGLSLGDDYHLDHKMPLALGGTNTDDNIQLLRQHCNNKKGKKHPVEFMQSLGFLI